MTEKAKRILAKMRKPTVQEEFKRSMDDDVEPVVSDKGDKFLIELNEMADLESHAGSKENPGR